MLHANLWTILAIAAIIALLYFGRRKSYTWIGLVLGILAGLIIALTYLFKGYPFSWSIIKKDAVTGTLIGSVLDLASRLMKTEKK